MKKLLLMSAVFFGLAAQSFASCGPSCAPSCPTPCAEESTGECYCKYVTYQPRHYCTTRCVEEQIPCHKTCCRYRTECYEVQKCRMVPEYYTETRSRQVPEYYTVEQYRTCKRYVQEPQVEYVPRYYWKHSCGTPSCNSCPSACPCN